MTVLQRILRALGRGAAGLLLAAVLVGYAAPYLPPIYFWWTDLFAVLLPPLSVAGALLAIGLAGHGLRRRRWGRVLLAGLFLGLLAVRFGPRLAAWRGPDDEAGLRVMTFNVPQSFVGAPAADVPMRAFVRREAPGILAFQESQVTTGEASSPVRLTRRSPPLRRLLGPPTGYDVPRVLPPNTNIYQPVIGRMPLDSVSVHPLPPADGAGPQPQYTRMTFSWRGRPAVLYNVHLHTIGEVRPWSVIPDWPSLDRWRAFLRSYRQGALHRARQARRLHRQIEQERRPVIVVGDFNSTPHQWAYRHIAQGLQNAATRRLAGWGATFPAQRPLVRIDHILVGPAWRVADAWVPAPTEPAISDHRAVVAELRWRD